MCLIALITKDKITDPQKLREGFDHNNDGWGMAYIDRTTGEIAIRKSVTGFPHFADNFTRILGEKQEGTPILVHFRLATHGAKDASMCHPFRVAHGWAMAHNGILAGYPGDRKASDTFHFINERLNPLFVRLGAQAPFEDKWITEMGAEIGHFNKLAFLTTGGGWIIVNSDQGHWDDEVWYSNCSYKEPRLPKWTTGTGIRHGWDDDYDYRRDKRDRDLEEKWTYRNGVWVRKEDDLLTADEAEKQALAQADANDLPPLDEDRLPISVEEYDVSMLECHLCNRHIKNKFFILKDDSSISVLCPACLDIYEDTGK